MTNQVTFKGSPVSIQGEFPQIGSKAADFEVVGDDLSTVKLSDFKGKSVVLNIIPSVDTPVCATQLREFSKKLESRDDVTLLFVSLDLPFAYNRFCAAEGIKNAVTTSDFRDHSVAKNYGVQISDGPLAGIYARAAIVIDGEQIIRHAELVSEIGNEPNYDDAINALNN